MNYYLDTCIWRDYYENRIDKFRPLGEWAFELIRRIVLDGEVLLISELVIRELSIDYSHEEIKKIFDIAKDVIVKVNISQDERVEAGVIAKERKLGRGDVLHAILARDNDAVLVSRDKHFDKLRDVVIVRKPEEII